MLNRLTRWQAAVLSIIAALAAAWCMMASPPPSRVGTMKITDTALYAQVIERVGRGEGYYPAVTTLQRDNAAPLKPFFTVRLPTLAFVQAALGPTGVRAAALALLGANCLAFFLLLRRSGMSMAEQACGVIAVIAGGMLVFMPALLVWHEIWAGLLLGLAVACMSSGRWLAALPMAVAAMAIRELAAPFAVLALALAAWDRDWRQCAAWGMALLSFAVALALHRHMVLAFARPEDIVSPGWNGLRGPVAVVDSLYDLTVLKALPRPAAYLAGLAPLLGWAALPGRQGRFPVLFFAGYGLMLALLARPDNYYWAGLMLPAWFAALPLVPRGIAMLLARVWRGAEAGVSASGMAAG